MSAAPRVLVVEDDAAIRELVVLHLGLEGFACTQAGDGRTALARLARERFDLLVLDVMLPGVDGVGVCRAVRRGDDENRDVPILMLTARREESDKVLGLESGADDYLTKPFGVRELVARVRALMRRRPAAAGAADGRPPIERHDIMIDPARRRVTARGVEVELTRQEFDLLHVLASQPGIVFSREALVDRAWPDDTAVTARSVDTVIKRLRRKIEAEPSEPRLLLTVWGSGYKFADV
jgi:DNA-binding response OmpR family regulator